MNERTSTAWLRRRRVSKNHFPMFLPLVPPSRRRVGCRLCLYREAEGKILSHIRRSRATHHRGSPHGRHEKRLCSLFDSVPGLRTPAAALHPLPAQSRPRPPPCRFAARRVQIVREGLDAMLNPPGSYCAYASVYLTVCLIRIFGLATKTYLEQQLHVGIIQVRVERDAFCFWCNRNGRAGGWDTPPSVIRRWASWFMHVSSGWLRCPLFPGQ